jgi:hypothetical protein
VSDKRKPCQHSPKDADAVKKTTCTLCGREIEWNHNRWNWKLWSPKKVSAK